MQRLRRSSGNLFGALTKTQLRKKALDSWSAVQDTYLSTKEIFERHRVVFAISTSLASIATAWFGYSLRYLHQTKVEQKLESIEKAMKNNYHFEHGEVQKIVGSSSTAATMATAGTTLVIGYGLGWRGGKWYANRQFRREQMKLLGQIKPRRWQFQFLRRTLRRPRMSDFTAKASEASKKDARATERPRDAQQPC